MYPLTIKRGAAVIAAPEIDESTIFSNEFMGEDKITSSFIVREKINARVGDYTEYLNSKYSIVHDFPPEFSKDDQGNFNYSISFFGELYSWYNKIVRYEGKQINFSLTLTPFQFLEILIDNINLIDPGWTIGDVELIDEPKEYTFSGVSCRVALTQIAEMFELEYYTENKKVFLNRSIGRTLHGVTFEQGQYNGLYELSLRNASGKFATIWYGEGGTQNLPEGYRNGANALTFDGNPILINNDIFPPREDTVSFPDIFPQRTGTVGSIDGDFNIIDPDIPEDMNINNIAAPGGAKITFRTGDLGGTTFPISAYDHSTRTLRIGIVTEDSGYTLPNEFIKAAPGDKYFITGVIMPASYVTEAEDRVKQRTIEHAQQNGAPKAVYSLSIDEHFVREIGYELQVKAGDRLPVKDTDMGLDAALRVQTISWPLVNPAAISAEIAEEVQYTQTEKIVKAVVEQRAQSTKSLLAALNARQLSDEVRNAAAYTLFKKTYIGDYSVLSGAFIAGNPATGMVAGIDGSAVNPTDVVFWSNATYEERQEAIFRVLLNGKAFMTGADITGHIVAETGEIGGFKINQNSLESLYTYGSGKFVLYPNDGYIAFIDNSVGYWAGIGANVFPVSGGIRGVGRFENTGFSGSDNYGIVVKAENGQRNYSLLLTGNIRCLPYTAIEGLQHKQITVQNDFQVTDEVEVRVVNNINRTITLPQNPTHGRIVCISNNQGGVWVRSLTSKIYVNDNTYEIGHLWHFDWSNRFVYDQTNAGWYLTAP